MTISSSASRRIELGVLGLVLAFAAGCAHDPSRTDPERPHGPAPIELTLRTPQGYLDVGDLHGQPVLLVFLTTYDTMCQAALVPLGRVARHHPEAVVLGVLAQAEAESFLDAYVYAANAPFTIGYDADDRVLGGQTAIGSVERVPLFIALDRDGREARRAVGYQSEAALEEMLRAADARVPAREVAPPPLLGTPSSAASP